MTTKIVQKPTFERLEALSVPQGGPRGPSDLILDTFGVILEALGHIVGPFSVIVDALGDNLDPFFR